SWNGFEPPIVFVGDGSVRTSAAPRLANTLYRVVVQDMDSDGDGVSDWAEFVTGFDPHSTHTNGSAVDDHAALAGQLPAENVVSVIASEPSTTQPPDAATAAASAASVTILRGGKLHFSSITVPLQKSGTAAEGMDYLALPSSVTFAPRVSAVKVPIVPAFNPNRTSNATATVHALAGGGYTVGAPSSASVVISPSGAARGTGLTGHYFNSNSATINAGYSSNLFAGMPALTRLDATVDRTWNSVSPGTGVNASYFAVRWAGQVQPQYSETYYFVTRTNDGVKLWVNGQLLVDKWSNQSGVDNTGAIELKAGVLYDIRMEYYQATGNGEAHLSWYSESQVKQIIPTARLYPAAGGAAAPSITNALKTVGFVGQPFSFTVAASNSSNATTTFALGTNSGPLPPGLSLNSATGLISGTPSQAGAFQVALTATSSVGVGSSILEIDILNTGNAITRELWTSGVTGAAISDIPVNTPPQSIDNSLVSLEDSASYGDGTAERLRGYFTAPATGNYYFWLAASNTAELWISNDGEPVNKLRRAFVAAPGTSAQTWNAQPGQKSAWLSLVEGQRYYFEVLHNKGVGTASDHV
ncbi:MAG TPA: PA14 domain-containing protein, partial [Chthoniobacterales bacterium]